MRSLAILRATGCPVVFDATHAVQQPGARGECVGRRARARARAWHEPRSRRASRGCSSRRIRGPTRRSATAPNVWPLGSVAVLLEQLMTIDAVVKSRPYLENDIQAPCTQGARSSHEYDQGSNGPRDHRLARQSHGRSRSRARERRARPRGRAVGRLDGLARSARAARRRQEALSRQGRDARPSRTSTARSAAPSSGSMPPRRATSIGGSSSSTARRTRRVSAPTRCSPCRSRTRRRTRRSAACALYELLGAGAGHYTMPLADDEHHQRRRARRQQRRHPGIHDPAGRRADASRSACATASRCFTR